MSFSNTTSIILIDSGSEDEGSPPKQQCTVRGRRGRGRKSLQSSRKSSAKPKSSRRASQKAAEENARLAFEENIELLDLDDGNIEEKGSTSEIPGLASDVITALEVVSAENEVDLAGQSELVTSTSNTDAPEPSTSQSQPVKTARRGLAKKNSGMQITGDTESSTHNTHIYSRCVAQGMRNFLYSVTAPKENSESDSTDKNVVLATTQATSTSSVSDGGDSKLSQMEETQSSSGASHEGQEQSDDEVKSVETPSKIRSPTPPPETSKPRRKAKRMNRTLSSALKTLSQAKVSLDKKTPPRKNRQKRESDVVFVGEDTVLIELTVKVRYLTNVHRITMMSNEQFHSLTAKLSEIIGEPEYNLSLFLNEEALSLSSCPLSVGLSVADIIECHCIKPNEENISPADAITLVIQCRNRRTGTNITANKRRPLIDVLHKYAEICGEDAGRLKLLFDGEHIDPLDTPAKLDMEDDDVIDVVIS